MTYEFSTFVSIVEDNPDTLGKQDREQFDSWAGMEKYELEKALGGEENMANFEYQQQQEETSSKYAENFKIFEVALRDTCVLAYRVAYDKKPDLKNEGESFMKVLPEINALTKIALMITD